VIGNSPIKLRSIPDILWKKRTDITLFFLSSWNAREEKDASYRTKEVA
jgi:hypothetical protein